MTQPLKVPNSPFAFNENTDACWEETEDWLINKGTPA